MSQPAAFLTVLTLTAVSLTGTVFSYDDDPGYGPYRERREFYGEWSGGRSNNRNVPLYYRPTQRYYGAGYTVNYRFVPVFSGDSTYNASVNGASNFRTEAFHLSPEDVLKWGANSPKIIVKDPRSAVPRTAVTTIIRKRTTARTSAKPVTDTPAIVPATTDAPAPVVKP